MKKFLLATVVLLGSISLANAERFSMGVTVTGGVFEADGASEIFSGDHAGNRTSDKVTKNSASEGEDAEAASLKNARTGNEYQEWIGIHYAKNASAFV